MPSNGLHEPRGARFLLVLAVGDASLELSALKLSAASLATPICIPASCCLTAAAAPSMAALWAARTRGRSAPAPHRYGAVLRDVQPVVWEKRRAAGHDRVGCECTDMGTALGSGCYSGLAHRVVNSSLSADQHYQGWRCVHRDLAEWTGTLMSVGWQ